MAHATRVTSAGRSRLALAVFVVGGMTVPPFFLSGCLKEEPPTAPQVMCADSVQPKETLLVRAVSRDRNGGNLVYWFDWGDGTGSGWTAELRAGDTFEQAHVYADSGVRSIRVRSRDGTGLVSDWCEGRTVAVGYYGPLPPLVEIQSGACYVDTVLWFSARAAHVRGESVAVQFEWDSDTGAWSGFAAAGAGVSDTHRFVLPGMHAVRARARDHAGSTSPWSSAESLGVVLPPVVRPTGLRLSASAGLFVRLRWDTGENHDSVRFAVWFRAVDSAGYRQVGTADEGSYLHDPFGATGEYTVSAFYGADSQTAAETLGTVPVFTDTLVVRELDRDSLAGFGWDTLTGLGGLRTMRDTVRAGLVDWYFSDFAPGYSGPTYYVVSPHLAPNDPGGAPPAAGWLRTGLLGITGNAQDPLPEYDSLYYQNATDVSSYLANCAVHTGSGYYALVTTFGPNNVDGTIRAVAWFQRVKGLRLIRHPE